MSQPNPNPAPSKEPYKPQASADTYIVGCKLPHGLHLELFAPDGKVIEAHKINGNNSRRIIGGYGLTDGIPRGFMDEWLERNANHPAVLNQSIFIHTNAKSAESAAKERRKERTGLEALDPIGEAKKRGLVLDSDAERDYRKQQAENPDRNRQIQE